MKEKLAEDVAAERARCEQIVETVFISARNILGACTWSPEDRIAWEARMRAASDILSVIRSGGRG